MDLAPSCSNSSTCCIMSSGSSTSVTVTATASNSNTTTTSASTSNETQQQRRQQPHPPQHMDQPPAVDYERQREELLGHQLHADRRFHELRPQLHQKRLAQIEKLQDDILNRRSDVFERRKQQLDVEFDTRRRNLLFAKQLRLGALERKLEGQRTFSADNLAMDQARSRQRIGAQIDAKLQRLAEEERQLGGKFCGLLDHNQPQQQPQHHQKRSPLNGRVQAQMQKQNGFLLHGINSNGISIRTTKSNNNNTRIDRYRGVQEDNSNQPAKAAATSIMPINRRVSSRRSGGGGGGGECRTRLRDLPILIAQLPRRAIAEDLAKAVAHPVAPAAAANAKFKPTTLSKSTASKPN